MLSIMVEWTEARSAGKTTMRRGLDLSPHRGH